MMKDPTKLIYLKPPKLSYFWLISIGGFRIGSNNIFSDGSKSAFSLPIDSLMTYAIVDTGSSLFYVAKSAF